MVDSKENVSAAMDEAAEKAFLELKGNLKKWSATQLAKWWAKWCMTAGHKRLGRALATIGKEAKDAAQAKKETEAE